MISDEVPAGASVIEESISDKGVLNDNMIAWNLTVPANTSGKVSFDCKIKADAQGKIVKNTANVTFKGLGGTDREILGIPITLARILNQAELIDRLRTAESRRTSVNIYRKFSSFFGKNDLPNRFQWMYLEKISQDEKIRFEKILYQRLNKCTKQIFEYYIEYVDLRRTLGKYNPYKKIPRLIDAFDTVVRMKEIGILKKHPLEFGAVYHCFDGDIAKAKSYYDMGVNYFGIGGKIFYEEELGKAVRFMPEESIVLETDAPYINLPERIGPNTSISLWNIAEKVASIRGTTKERIIELTTKNSEKLFRIRE